jgi:hypothetical protein
MAGSAQKETIEKLNTYFTVFWICMAAGIPLCVILIGIPAVIAAVVYSLMLHYQVWKQIPPDIARTTPSKAVGFQFIPIFNLYWEFVAYWGLAIDMNETFRRRGIQYQVSEGMGLTYCILFLMSNVLCFFPIDSPIGLAGLVIFILVLIIFIFFMKTVEDGAIVLLEHGEE